MATIRAKFVCQEELRTPYKARTYKFAPVYSNKPEHENKAFWDATPQGSLQLTITNEAAWVFELGQEYYLDITPAPASDV